MTREQVIAKYPNASESFIRANVTVTYANHEAYRLACSPQLEPNSSNESVVPAKGADSYPKRRRVFIESCRVRLIDSDNLCAKYFIDALVKAGVLYDDSPQWCEVAVNQVKVSHRCQERTIIQIEEEWE